MWYTLPDSTKQYPLTIDRVKKIRSLNQQGAVPEELEAVDVTSTKSKEIEPEFVDVVGQISLRSLEKSDKKRRQQQHDRRKQEQGFKSKGQQPGNQQQPDKRQTPGNKPQQGKGQQQQPPRPNQQKKLLKVLL